MRSAFCIIHQSVNCCSQAITLIDWFAQLDDLTSAGTATLDLNFLNPSSGMTDTTELKADLAEL